MKHLGDITKISGYTAPIVDCIIGGSPCQGLSVAGEGKGLADERSGLFTEQVRIAKEMRKADVQRGRSGVDVRPRYMVWENVPGAFSSNGGDDFRVVLEELARVIEEGVTIPRPPKGKWATTGVIILDGGSLAWRVFDAQFWGVPQRRRRICIVVDFNGHTAPQIVFSEGEHHGSTERGDRKPSVGYIGEEPRPEIQSVCEGLSRHLEQSQPQRENPSPDASGSLGAGDSEGGSIGIDLYNTQITGDVEATLGVNCGMSHGRNGVCTFEPGIASREGGHIYEGVSGTLRAKAGDNQMSVAYTMQDREGKAGGGKGALIAEEKSATLRANNWQYVFQPSSETLNAPYPCSWDGGQTSPTLTARNASGCQRMPDKDNFNAVLQPIAIDMGGGKSSVDLHLDRSPTLTTTHYGEPAVVYDARGNGDDTVAPTMTGDHQNRVTDYTGVVVSSEPSCYSKLAHGFYKADDVSSGLKARDYKGDGDLVLMEAYQHQGYRESDVCNTLTSGQNNGVRGDTPLVTYIDTSDGDIAGTLDASYYKGCGERQGKERTFVVKSVDARNCTENDVNGSLQSNSAHSLNGNNVVRVKYIVRRLTPLECERLQGFPDNHTNIGEYIDTKGKKCKTSDASRYKALGNSIALPSWKYILKRLCSHYERDATMASLFDGIGGFPILWEQINGKGSCLWASEIEEFPIAVTKERISK
jgi:DNA (cytosine-5)-methyltransferase 1